MVTLILAQSKRVTEVVQLQISGSLIQDWGFLTSGCFHLSQTFRDFNPWQLGPPALGSGGTFPPVIQSVLPEVTSV